MSLHLPGHSGPNRGKNCPADPHSLGTRENWEERCHTLEAALTYQASLTKAESVRAERAERELESIQTQQPSAEIVAAATKAAQGGVVAISPSPNGKWEIHNPSMVLLETAARHLGCCTRTIKRLAKRHGIPISPTGGPRINLRKLIASMEEAAA